MSSPAATNMIPYQDQDQDQADPLGEVEQHCLLFPSYATKHPNSSLARKIAGVTKNDSVYDILESRFSMFLASNTQGVQFIVQCVGPSKAKQMELAGDPTSSEPAVVELIRDLQSPDVVFDANEVVQSKEQLRRSLEVDRQGRLLPTGMDHDSHRAPPTNRGNSPRYRSSTPESMSSDYERGQQPPRGFEGGLPTIGRLQRGAALIKSAYSKYKSIVATPDDMDPSGQFSESSGGARSFSSGSSGSEASFQDSTQYRDYGSGVYPTVQVLSRPGGHFHGTLQLSRNDISSFVDNGSPSGSHPRSLRLHAYHPGMKDRTHGIVNLVDPVGLSIISDIDDTIKETNVQAGARTIMRNTFLEDMKAVDGMADVYQRWWKGGAAIHYVSNSPWQLIQSLLEFFHSHNFPPGSAHLRLHDSVLKTYFMSPSEHKHRAISEILDDFPERKFILIGDSGEIDMEIYTHFARLHPEQIVRIFIRDISTDRLKEMAMETSTPQNEMEMQYFPPNDITGARYPDSWDHTATAGSAKRHGQDHGTESTYCDKLGQDTSEPIVSTPKSPLEIWLDRIEDCQRQLPEGKLTLFKSADVLDSCSIAESLLKKYKTEQAFSDEGWLQDN
ncbi:hypothetical protein BGW38_008494 [Lunasporangiospora selenospora]|uniref:Phosphatidate phosphatase APP1 catalytic domain-containing protein n=1 Tax=Lunasporangiospora selenospora TaxID=979761 RepID=A0A9P6FY73_9FUNG|nr:hypothetical protein BGW38_008494 [Lunasporangiospora selenospora]